MKEQLRAIAERAGAHLIDLITDGETEILKTWAAVAREAALQEVGPKLKLGFTIIVDIDKQVVDYDLSWSVRHKLSVSDKLEDPKQEKLDLDEKPRVKVGE
jgi:hypothetical protein